MGKVVDTANVAGLKAQQQEHRQPFVPLTGGQPSWSPPVEPETSGEKRNLIHEAVASLIAGGGMEVQVQAEGTDTFSAGGFRITIKGTSRAVTIERKEPAPADVVETPALELDEPPVN